jgi:multiple sugar transport system substrate-binding protein
MSGANPRPSQFDRRNLLRGTAGAGVAAAGIAIAGPRAGRAFAAPNLRQGLTGTIRVAYADEAGYKPKYVEQAAAAVEAANPGATVEIDVRQVAGGDFLTQLLLELDGGEGPDVIHLGGDRIGQFADTGYITPLDPYLAQWPDWTEQYPESVRSGVMYGGQTWAIPYGLDVRWLYYRRDRLEEAGLSRDWQPTDLASILEAATALKDADLGIDPYILYAGVIGSGGSTTHGFLPVLLANGGTLLTPDGRWVSDSPAITAAYQYYVDAWQKLQVVPSSILTTPEPWKPSRTGIGTGGVGLLFEGGWVYGGYQSAAADGSVDLAAIGYSLFPTTEAGPTFTIGGPGTCWYIGAGSQHPDLAWEFIKAFNTPQILADLNIEDPHPVARMDAAALPQFQAQTYLVDCTNALGAAIFLPALPQLNDVSLIVQNITGEVATGDLDAAGAAQRYAEELTTLVGGGNVVGVTESTPLQVGTPGATPVATSRS